MSDRSALQDNKVLARLELIASVLEIDEREINGAMRGDQALMAFANKYGQSFDWIIVGDVREMILRGRRYSAAR
jgi:hypothetical protein